MIIRRHAQTSRNNPAPTTKRDKEDARRHARELEQALENRKCPTCGAPLEEHDELYDHGYRYGFSCVYCS